MTEAIKANHDGSGIPARNISDHHAAQPVTPLDSAQARLLVDLKAVVADAQAMIVEATDAPANAFAALRSRFDEKLFSTRARLNDARRIAADNAKQASAATRAYVTANPWKSAGMLAGASLLFGFALAKYHSASVVDETVQ